VSDELKASELKKLDMGKYQGSNPLMEKIYPRS